MKTRVKRWGKRVLAASQTASQLYRVYSLFGFWRHLDEIGWFASRLQKFAVTSDGGALPWFTYPAIAFLKERTAPDLSVFEYGSGQSTLWWSSQVAEMASCEHDRAWYQMLQPRLPSNVHYLHYDLEPGGLYAKAIQTLVRRFDVVVIDGRDRVNCAKNSVDALTERGVVVWDNSDRSRYEEGYRFLIDRGFKRLDFWGLGPVNHSSWCTSIFYRRDNCLAI